MASKLLPDIPIEVNDEGDYVITIPRKFAEKAGLGADFVVDIVRGNGKALARYCEEGDMRPGEGLGQLTLFF